MNLENLIGALLGEMRARANRFFDADVTRAVLGRPARFSRDDADDRFAQYRLERAARIAGFTEVDFLPEPIAAAREFRTTLDRAASSCWSPTSAAARRTSPCCACASERYDPSDVLAIGGVSVAGDAFDAALMRHHVSRHFGAEVTYRVPFGAERAAHAARADGEDLLAGRRLAAARAGRAVVPARRARLVARRRGPPRASTSC